MHKRYGLLLAAILCLATCAKAQSALDGTWKFDKDTAKFPTKPDEYLLKDGMYHCKTCVPQLDVKADGQDHSVTGHPYYDTANIKMVDDHSIEETYKKSGKVVSTSKSTVSADGSTVTFEFSDSSASSGDPVTGKGQATRVGKVPAAAHAISGSWRTAKMDTISDNAMTVTFKVNGDTLAMSNPTGQAYTAKLDGTDAPYKGDPGTTSVSVKKMGPNSIEETDKRDGKVISVSRLTVSADGKTLKVQWQDKLHGTSGEVSATKM